MTPASAPGATLRYPLRAVVADVARAAAGVAAAGLPLLAAQPPAWLALVLAALLVLFALFLAASLRRARRGVRLDDGGLWLLPGDARLRWDALRSLRLDYYSTRRDGRGGWLELRLAGEGCTLRVDSRLAGFDTLLAHAARAARRRGIALAPATLANLEALGLPGAVAR